MWKWETNSITCLNAPTSMIYENAHLIAERSRKRIGKPVYIREMYIFLIKYNQKSYYVFLVQPSKRKTLCGLCAMLDQRRRRWADVVQMLCRCFVFAGKVIIIYYIVIHLYIPPPPVYNLNVFLPPMLTWHTLFCLFLCIFSE